VTRGPDIHPRKVLRIARWEVEKAAGVFRRRTLVLVLVGVVVAGVAGPTVLSGEVSLDREIYGVGVDQDSPYYDVVRSDRRFVAREPSPVALNENRIDLLVRDGGIDLFAREFYESRRELIEAFERRGDKRLAAYVAFRRAVQSYNDHAMELAVARGKDPAAASPVEVVIRYESRSDVRSSGEAGPGTQTQPGTDEPSDPDTGTPTDGDESGGTTSTDGGGGEDGDGESRPTAGTPTDGEGNRTQDDEPGQPPSGIDPPFPFRSLVLGFLFIIPMNFVVQSYGSTIMDERINRRGELLLVAPISRSDIIVGKTLPYFSLLVVVTVAIAVAIGGGATSVAAILPLALVYLAATFVAAMFARSFKELTFVTVTISVFLTSFAFVPAIFTDVTPIALISPLTVVIRDLEGTGVAAGEFLFSTGPTLLSGVVLFVLGAGVYREEDMFTQRPVHLKAVDALAARIVRPRSLVLWSALFIPFVLVAELLALAVLFVLPVPMTVVGLLVAIALVEEVAKSAHVFVGFEYARYDRSWRTALLVGALSGLGFFLGEKLLVVVQAVGIPNVQQGQGQPIFPPGVEGLDPVVAVVLLVAPLALHVVTAAISALGARRDPLRWIVGIGVAAAVHVVYNYGVIEVIGGAV